MTPGKLEALRQGVAKLGAEALLVTAPANVRYLSGFGTEDGGVDKYLVQPQTPVSEKAFKAGAYKPVQEAYPGFDMYARALFESKRFLFPPKIPTAAGYGTILGKYVGEARNGTITAKEALNRATQEAQAELDQAGGPR